MLHPLYWVVPYIGLVFVVGALRNRCTIVAFLLHYISKVYDNGYGYGIGFAYVTVAVTVVQR